MFFVTDKFDQSVFLKKLDRTEVTFKFCTSLFNTTKYHYKNNQMAEYIIYKLEEWAQEWLRLIYTRHNQSFDLEKLGQQTKALLKYQENIGGSWFKLFSTN